MASRTLPKDFDPDFAVHAQQFTPSYYHDVYPSINPSNPALTQENKVVVIAGATGGIGPEYARAFAKARAKGLVLSARRPQPLEELKTELNTTFPEIDVLTVTADVSSEKDVQNIFKEAAAKFGSIDIVISNAGAQTEKLSVEESDTDKWWKDFEVNVRGLYLISKSFIKHLNKERTGSLFNITSGVGLEIIPGRSNYSVGKGAAHRLIEYINSENKNLRVFSVHPGIIPTEFLSPLFAQFRHDTPALVSGVLLWLTQDKADFLRGRWISSNWSVDDLEARKEEIVKQNLLTVKLNAKLGKGGHPFDKGAV